MTLEDLKDDLFLLCRYDTNEPNHYRYNKALLDTIDQMSFDSVMFALTDLGKVQQ